MRQTPKAEIDIDNDIEWRDDSSIEVADGLTVNCSSVTIGRRSKKSGPGILALIGTVGSYVNSNLQISEGVLNIGSEKNFAAASLKLAIIVGTDNSNGDQSLSTLNLYGGNLGNLSVNTKNTVALKTLEISTITRNANFEKDAIFSVKIGFDKDANQYQASALNLTDKGNFGIATFKTNLTLQIDVEKKPNTSQEFAILTAKK